MIRMSIRVSLAALAVAGTLAAAGCRTCEPLTLRHYSRNLVLGTDRMLRLDGEVVDFANLKRDLVRHCVTDEAPIAVHIPHGTPPEIFDALVNRLQQDGFRNVSVVVYWPAGDGSAAAAAKHGSVKP